MATRHNGWLKWALGAVVVPAVLGVSGWAGLTLYDHAQRISKVEQQGADIADALKRIEDKLDAAILRH